MIQTQNPLYKTFLVFVVIFLIPCALANVIALFSTPATLRTILNGSLCILGLLAAFYYAVRGYNKQQAWAYKLFVACYALGKFCSVLFLCTETDRMLPVAVDLVLFALILILTVGKDLGKPLSLSLCGAVVVITVLDIVDCVLRNPDLFSSGSADGISGMLRLLSTLFFSILLTICTAAKYIDKTARGTK